MLTMRIELINTGSELLIGQTQNTHHFWMAQQLGQRGYRLDHQSTIHDAGPAIREALETALSRSDLVMTTGGLGPTSDDRTRDDIAELLQKPLRSSQSVVDHIRDYFESRGRPMPERVTVQAMVPEGATVWMNAFGTAPGLLIALGANPFREGHPPAWIAMFPGPPRELHPMFLNQFIPWLVEHLPLPESFACRILRTSGLGESWVEERLQILLKDLTDQGLDIGYCARSGEVDIRFVASGSQANAFVDEACRRTYADLGDLIHSEGKRSLESALVEALRQKGMRLALAESCTGGFIAHQITNVPGASDVFQAGVVSYANQSKVHLLGVDAETINQHGAVSEKTAKAMVEGVLAETEADVALAVTGIAGPSGGTPDKPVGTVFLGLADHHETHVFRRLNPYDRETFKFVTAHQGMELLRRKVLGLSLKL